MIVNVTKLVQLAPNIMGHLLIETLPGHPIADETYIDLVYSCVYST